ncbi:hypothetical protein DFQ27_006971 [Actinomortierella ambigua]|uniref:ATP-dependent bile acid permease n=1 Tax=Actinomortierella ambigua TaxID=1343610 RepID=A0A9P6UC21_9FUNG|nr:hypothetical protein DFQ27_006971 [Actinomortierella ambigua]
MNRAHGKVTTLLHASIKESVRGLVLDAGAPLVLVLLSLLILAGSATYHYIRRNNAGHQSQYMPILSHPDMPSAEADLDDDLNEDPIYQSDPVLYAASGRRISRRDVLKVIGSFIALGISIAWLVVRWGTDHSTYLFLAPLISLCTWVYISVLTVAHLFRPHNPLVSLSAHFAVFFLLNLPIAFFRLRSQVLHRTSQTEFVLAVAYFANAVFLSIMALTSSQSGKPVQSQPGKRVPCPESHASVVDLAFFSWADPLIRQGFKSPIKREDVWDFKLSDYSSAVIHHFRQAILATRKNHGFLMRLFINFKRPLAIQIMWAIAWGALHFVGPYGLERILHFVSNRDKYSIEWGYFYVVSTLFGMILFTIAQSQMLWLGRRISIHLRSIIVGEIYAKALRRKDRAGQTNKGTDADKKDKDGDSSDNEDEEGMFSNGAINNMISNDTSEISGASAYLQDLYVLPLMVLLAIGFLYRVVGAATIGAIGSMIACIPLNIWFTQQYQKVQEKLMKAMDTRSEMTNELLQAIRVVKFFSWERNFYKKIDEAREKELAFLWGRYFLWVFGAGLWFATPVIVTVTTFFMYTRVFGNVLTAEVAFPAIALINVLRQPMDAFPEVLSVCLRARVSSGRIDRFLDEEEVELYTKSKPRKTLPSDPIIGFKNATFSYASKSEQATADAAADAGSTPLGHHFELKDLNLEFPVGELSVIAGPTGSGKTTMLLSLLGEINAIQGQAFLPRRDSHVINPVTDLTNGVAYVAQQAWLQNNTIRNNILFGSPFEQRRYDQVVEMCALTRDFEILEFGDQTEIGERGITLSGGQKQRIALARAIYSRAGHILMDDCLSAVDAHTAKWLFAKCLMGPLMQGRTRILVTHAVSLTLRGAAHVVVLKNGNVVAQGSPSDVLASNELGEEIANEEHAFEEEEHHEPTIEEAEDENGSSSSTAAAAKSKSTKRSGSVYSEGDDMPAKQADDKQVKKLIEEEHKAEGSISWRIYQYYFGSMGGIPFWVFLMFSFIMMQVFHVASDAWLRFWASSTGDKAGSDGDQSYMMATSFADVSTSAKDMAANVTNLILAFSCQSEVLQYTLGERISRICRQEIFDIRQPVSPISTLGYMPSEELGFAALGGGSSKQPAGNEGNDRLSYYLGVYALLSVMYILTVMVRQYIQWGGSVAASRKIHRRLLANILGAPIRFFDTTPVGRIMNRFTKDMETVDQETAPVASSLMFDLLGIITNIAVISYVTPKFLFAAFFIAIMFYLMAGLYLRTSRELKRIESVTKSPVFSHFGESLSGVSTIRAFGQEKRFIYENLELMDEHNRPFFYLWVCNRWLSVRVDLLSAFVTFFAGLFIILNPSLDAGTAGLSLSYSLMFTDHILWLVRLYSEIEMNMNSVERIREYTDLPQEPPATVEGRRPPPGWPHNGEITVENLVMQYSPDDPPVIRDVSFHVKPREKIGIVGRTGAGKSTLAVAFFRFMELSGGKITIDGLDISSLGLHDLRSSLTIIPQDPVLFMGTIRSNLDPFGEHTDNELWAALKRAHLVSEDGSGPNPIGNLDVEVHENGNNFSQGQRQLISLARALLKQSSILILDEATASVDSSTDARIQATIREEFKNATLLTIAHRLRTICDYDKVLVLDHGQVAQYDTPMNLLRDEGGIFKGMCQRSGEYELLVEMAAETEKKRLQSLQGL